MSNLMDQETLLKRAHIALIKHPQTTLFTGVILMGKNEIEDDPAGTFTAYTNGVDKRYSRTFLATIKTEAQRRGLVLHENLHIALKHMIRGIHMMKENHKLAGVAADLVVNDIIYQTEGTIQGSDERIVMLPDGAVHDTMFRGWSMREIYEYLKKTNEDEDKPKPGGKPCEDGDEGDDEDKPKPGGKPCEDGEKPDDDEGDEESNDPPSRGTEDKPKPKPKPSTVIVNGKEYPLDQADEHDISDTQDMTGEELKELDQNIDKAIREGGIVAGRMGVNMPRAITEMLAPVVDWKEALRDFITSSVKGKDEFSWRRLNKRQLANDIYLPGVDDETLSEVVVAIDTSGSIGGKELALFAKELASICETASPDKVRVLWWDTMVHGEQVFIHNYSNIEKMLKPQGGGGTRAGCVNDYINKNRITADCVIVFTDGYIENDVTWNVPSPTLWLITKRNDFTPPAGGRKVMVRQD